VLEVVHPAYYTRVRSPGRAALVLATLVVAVTLAPAGSARSAPAAPGFRVKLFDSVDQFDSREVSGKKVLVLRFQASYCKPCVRESPALGRLVDRYRDRPVEFLAFHVQDTAADTRRFIKAQKVTYRVALDPRLAIGNTFGFKGTPYTVVVDLNGEMVAQLHGESAVSRLPRIIDGALARAPKG
jgi:thiol-disulfide isomerase/thioredoxin